MNKLKFNVAEKELYYQGEVIVKYSIEYPEIVFSPYEAGKQAFNYENRKQALDLKEFAEGEFYEQAKEVYQYNKEHGYPVMVFELILETKVTFQNNRIISLYQDEYTFSGGAHGNTIRNSQNWNLLYGRMIELQEFYPNNQ